MPRKSLNRCLLAAFLLGLVALAVHARLYLWRTAIQAPDSAPAALTHGSLAADSDGLALTLLEPPPESAATPTTSAARKAPRASRPLRLLFSG